MTDEKKVPDEELKEVDGGVKEFNPHGPKVKKDRPYGTKDGGRPAPDWADEDSTS